LYFPAVRVPPARRAKLEKRCYQKKGEAKVSIIITNVIIPLAKHMMLKASGRKACV
jgi:hypothetical protein